MSKPITFFLFLLLFSVEARAAFECQPLVTPLQFPNYRPLQAITINAQSTLTIDCQRLQLVSVLVNYEIRFSAGNSGQATNRWLHGVGNRLNYNLYRDVNRTQVLGDSASGTVTIRDSFLLNIGRITRNYPIYARIPAGQNVPAGNYNDTVVVTVSF